MSDSESRFLQALKAIGNKTAADKTLGSVVKTLSEGPDDTTESVETDEIDDSPTKVAEEKPAYRPTHINLFQHPDAHPLVLDILLLHKYGPEWFTWEAETLQWRIPQDFHTSDVSDLNLSKIQAMKTLHFVDTPWLQWEVFVWCAMPLNGLFPDFEIMQVPTMPQALVAVDLFNKVRQDVPWSDEVKTYLSTVWRHDGLFVAQDPADFIEIDRTNAEDLDYAKILEQWPTVRKSGVVPNEDTAEAEQLKRMLDAHHYLEENRQLFDNQIGLVLDE